MQPTRRLALSAAQHLRLRYVLPQSDGRQEPNTQRPRSYKALVIMTDGSTYETRCREPNRVFVNATDMRNAPPWVPKSDANLEDSALRRFRNQYGALAESLD